MPTARRSRTVPAELDDVWALLADAHHLPRWWPGVRRVEAVTSERFTEVQFTKRGHPVRLDFVVRDREPPRRLAWAQEVEGTPFERVLVEAVTEFELEAGPGGTAVTIELRQRLRGYSRTGGWMLRRAAGRRLDEALDGLVALFGAA